MSSVFSLLVPMQSAPFPSSPGIALPKYEMVPKRNHGKPRELSAVNRIAWMYKCIALQRGAGEQTPPFKRGFALMGASSDGAISMLENATNILPFRRNSLREPPFCAQCRAPMKIDRCEPDFKKSSSMVITYRCAECSLLERQRACND
jgi:hypothetical protein